MTDVKKFDLKFWESSRTFFQQYTQQKSEIFRLFEELSNKFPKQFQTSYFKDTKGNKISQGYNLEGFPYQVIDFIRNFDNQTGFNIRILNWVGNGLYIFIYIGRELAGGFLKNISGSKNFNNSYTGNCPFQYSDIVEKSEKAIPGTELITSENLSVFWEKVPLQENFSDNLNLLKSKIEMAFEYTT